MIKTADLKAQTRRELADIAKNYGVSGWHGMKKDELVEAIKKVQRQLRRKAAAKAAPPATSKKPTAKSPVATTRNGTKARQITATKTTEPVAMQRSKPAKASAKRVSLNDRPIPQTKPPRVSEESLRVRAHMKRRQESIQQHKDLSTGTLVAGSAVQNGADRSRSNEPHNDRAVLLVRDAYWLQASWEITRASVKRAECALAERWHTAVPTLRLLTVGDTNGSCSESVCRDITIHGGVNNWYIDVDNPPARFRVLIGYLADSGEFHALCRSNIVETPRPGECERLDEHWSDIAEDYERIYSLSGGYDANGGDLKEMFEDRLHRSMPLRGESGGTRANPTLLRESKLIFDVDAELIVFGKTNPSASVMIAGKPVKTQPDGSFTVRMDLPDRRQVLPVTAETRDGLRQRTTVIAVERNTKVMETVEVDDRIQ